MFTRPKPMAPDHIALIFELFITNEILVPEVERKKTMDEKGRILM
jgi:hypothetical protein